MYDLQKIDQTNKIQLIKAIRSLTFLMTMLEILEGTKVDDAYAHLPPLEREYYRRWNWLGLKAAKDWVEAVLDGRANN